MHAMLLHKLAEHIPEDYVPPQKPIADAGKMVSAARDAGLLRDGAGLRSTQGEAQVRLQPRHLPAVALGHVPMASTTSTTSTGTGW